MASTRTSDHTFMPRHAKRLVYAYLLAVIGSPLATAGRAGLEAAQPAPAPTPVPCVECQILSLAPSQIDPLPASLHGLRVAVQLDPARAADARGAVEALRRRGAIPGLHLTGPIA